MLGNSQIPVLMLDFAIGQFDTYTPLQLAQYVSTIANGGYRLKPQLVKEIRHPSTGHELGPVMKPFEPIILNKIDMSNGHIRRVQEGFRRVMETGTAARLFSNFPYKPAGKTGTAESFYRAGNTGPFTKTNNLTLVRYAPYDNPEIAFSIVVPYLDNDNNSVNKEIGKQVLEKYFELKREKNIQNPQENKVIGTEPDTNGSDVE